MRTVTNAISKTCPNCGALNRLVIRTTGRVPSWRIVCSQCSTTIVGTPPAPTVGATVHDGSAKLAKGGDAATAIRHSKRQPDMGTGRWPRHAAWAQRARAAAPTGAGLLAACVLVFSGLATEPAMAPAYMGAAGMGAAGPAKVELSAVQPGMPGPDTDTDMGAATLPGTAPNGAAPHPRQFAMGPVSVGPVSGEPASGHQQAANPDPHARMMQQRAADHAVAMARNTETELDLSTAKRREIQRRLRLAGYKPGGVDGIFGPGTRKAIIAWQMAAGHAPSGYVSKHLLHQLGEKTDGAYRAWRAARAAQRERQVAYAPTPPPRPGNNEDACARRGTGKIVYGQNFHCDVQGLGESLDAVGDSLAQLLNG